MPVRSRGRPARRASRSLRQHALALIDLLGPGVGVAVLQALCPELARREVQDLLRRYRRAWRRKRQLLAWVLHWTRPGVSRCVQFAKGESDEGLDLVQPIVVEGELLVFRHKERGEFRGFVELRGIGARRVQ